MILWSHIRWHQVWLIHPSAISGPQLCFCKTLWLFFRKCKVVSTLPGTVCLYTNIHQHKGRTEFLHAGIFLSRRNVSFRSLNRCPFKILLARTRCQPRSTNCQKSETDSWVKNLGKGRCGEIISSQFCWDAGCIHHTMTVTNYYKNPWTDYIKQHLGFC